MDKIANFRGIGTTEEYFDVLSTSGQPTGQIKPRSEVHRDGDWHQAVLIWILNSQGELLLQRRAPDKDSHPNQLDVSCGGHVVAGESVLETAVAEIQEELGLKIRPEELEFIAYWKDPARGNSTFVNNCFYTMYLLRADYAIHDMTPQSEEITELKYVLATELKAMVERRDPELVQNMGNRLILHYLGLD